LLLDHDVDESLELALLEEPAARAGVSGELVAPAEELLAGFAATLVARPQTERINTSAPARGSCAGSDAGDRASATIKKYRAALNSFLRYLAEHEYLPARQAREALAVRLPRARRQTRDAPKGLSDEQYQRLIREAKARNADEPLAGARDLAIILKGLLLAHEAKRWAAYIGRRRAAKRRPRRRGGLRPGGRPRYQSRTGAEPFPG
jgi:integrase